MVGRYTPPGTGRGGSGGSWGPVQARNRDVLQGRVPAVRDRAPGGDGADCMNEMMGFTRFGDDLYRLGPLRPVVDHQSGGGIV